MNIPILVQTRQLGLFFWANRKVKATPTDKTMTDRAGRTPGHPDNGGGGSTAGFWRMAWNGEQGIYLG